MLESTLQNEKPKKLDSSFLVFAILPLAFVGFAYLLQFAQYLLNGGSTIASLLSGFFNLLFNLSPYIMLLLFVILYKPTGWLTRILLAVAFGLFSISNLYYLLNVAPSLGSFFESEYTSFIFKLEMLSSVLSYVINFSLFAIMTALTLVPNAPKKSIMKATAIAFLVFSCISAFFNILYYIVTILSFSYRGHILFLFISIFITAFSLAGDIILAKFFLKLASHERL